MKWLVLIHIVSAILGIGPTYFGHILLRKSQNNEQLRQSLALFQLLNYFPKIGGTLAVVTGLALVALTGWKFSDVWILISLVLYVIIQVVVVGMLTPVMNQLNLWLSEEQSKSLAPDTVANKGVLLSKANKLYNTASILGIVLIILMIVKPM
ncbi:DUF2269 family protein [Paenibacillus oryzisoli]|uniref:DUF2269 domain-containing protein n=1 Tax=Paenibacillus oryzisoli TaxID=1850517 RepID=A0A198AAB0_9BACL|nr:DUF2269 family protein [Paenibacillus oryzisoli]OAS18429.1 hypothetical protein A8708_00410 [Paenibacillus oryzisoli]